MSKAYEYRLPGRRPIVWFTLAAVLFLLAVAWQNNAPWWAWAILLPAVAVITYMLALNPVSGIRLTQDSLTLSAWRKPQDISLGDIEAVVVTGLSDSTSVEIHLKSGEKIPTFSGDMPPASDLVAELSARDVPVVQR
jgi:hypothetical protein